MSAAAAEPVKRGRGKATSELIRASHDLLEQIQPATVRAVCYKLFTKGLIPDMSKGSTNKVSRLLVEAREEGSIPWEWIVDETRESERIPQWDDLEAYAAATAEDYRRDRWKDQPVRVEVWSEKGTMRGVLAPVLREYGVAFRVMHGYGSATSIKQIADESAGEDVVALYLGDWDPSGMHMSEHDLPERLVRYAAHTVELKRIALVKSDTPNLPHFAADTKSKDARHKWFVRQYGQRCWELDAMDPRTLRDRVEGHIRTHIERDAWALAATIEEAEMQSLKAYASGLGKMRPSA